MMAMAHFDNTVDSGSAACDDYFDIAVPVQVGVAYVELEFDAVLAGADFHRTAPSRWGVVEYVEFVDGFDIAVLAGLLVAVEGNKYRQG